jgi:hypothetical protein
MMLVTAVPEDDMVKSLNESISAHASWSRASGRSTRTKPGRDKFMEKVRAASGPGKTLLQENVTKKAVSAGKAYMLQLAKR